MIITRERSTLAPYNFEIDEGSVSESDDGGGSLLEMIVELLVIANSKG